MKYALTALVLLLSFGVAAAQETKVDASSYAEEVETPPAIVGGIQALSKHYECGSGSIHFGSGAARYCKGGKSGQDAYLDEILTQRKELDIRILGQPVHRSLIELYFSLPLRTRVDTVTGP